MMAVQLGYGIYDLLAVALAFWDVSRIGNTVCPLGTAWRLWLRSEVQGPLLPRYVGVEVWHKKWRVKDEVNGASWYPIT
jgi:hypothetical protein